MILTQLYRIKHPSHPHQEMAGGMMSPNVFALVSTTPCEILERVGKFFVVPRTTTADVYQRTEERRWIAMKTQERNNDNVNTFLLTMFDRVITQVYHTSGTKMGRGGFGALTPKQIYNIMRA